MKEPYIEKRFSKSSLAIINKANNIINEFAADGYDLTLRQLYYQFVARDLIANKQTEYKRLGSIINDARLAGLVDWESIIDRTRQYESLMHWSGPADRLRSAARSYRIDTRADQDHYIEVWVEKDALVGIIEQACDPRDVGYLSCRGYVSQSAMWRASQRLIMAEEFNKDTFIIHLGDHDPSGVDMTRDIQDRLRMFCSNVIVERIALNMEQIKQYNPPPNPVKATDSRHAPYIRKYGPECWELDALDPHVLTELIDEALALHTQHDKRSRQLRHQADGRSEIEDVAENWGG